MRVHPLLVAAILAVPVLVSIPRVTLADCLGFFNETEKGYKFKDGHLEPTDETVAAGTSLKFKGIGEHLNKFYLTRSRSDVVYDSQNIELTSGCSLPTVDLGRQVR